MLDILKFSRKIFIAFPLTAATLSTWHSKLIMKSGLEPLYMYQTDSESAVSIKLPVKTSKLISREYPKSVFVKWCEAGKTVESYWQDASVISSQTGLIRLQLAEKMGTGENPIPLDIVTIFCEFDENQFVFSRWRDNILKFILPPGVNYSDTAALETAPPKESVSLTKPV